MALRRATNSRAYGDAAGDFDADYGFEGLQLAGLGNRETQEQLFDGIFVADVLDGGLGSHGGVAGEDEHGLVGVEAAD